MEHPDPRKAAFRILRRVQHHGGWSGPLLQRLDAAAFAPRDLALANELTLGVLRRRIALDAVIAAFSTRPIERIDPDVRVALQMGVYQILFLDRIPPHAAVNETVKLAGRGASGFANALLRAALADAARARRAAAGEEEADPIDRIAVAESFPSWLARRWAARDGQEGARALMAAQNRPAPVTARVVGGAARVESVLEELGALGLAAVRSPLLEDIIRVDGAVQHSEPFRQGRLYIQDEASVLVARLAGVRPGDRVLDACAAPGGKSFIMAERAGSGGMVVACDRDARRLAQLMDNASRLGLACPPLAADMETGDPFAPEVRFDVVMVDAPCSGTGVIRRNPELRYRASPHALARLAEAQARLLAAAARRVRPGGALVYSVCSLEPEEGDDRIEELLGREPGFHVEDAGGDLPPGFGGPFLRTRPDRDDLDGFFAVRLRRQGS